MRGMSIRDNLQNALEAANSERIQASERVQEFDNQLVQLKAKTGNARAKLAVVNETCEKADKNYQKFREYCGSSSPDARNALELELRRLAQDQHVAVLSVQSAENSIRHLQRNIIDLERTRAGAQGNFLAANTRWEQIKKELESSAADLFD